MHRIDGPGAAPGGFFTDGDPATGTPATVVTEDWANAVQGELEAVATAVGQPLAKGDNAQVLAAIRGLISQAIPPGVILDDAGTALPPTGWLKCNGAAVSRAAYPALFARIGTTYGAGDGVSTFNVPELRGEFTRGLDDGRGVDVNPHPL